MLSHTPAAELQANGTSNRPLLIDTSVELSEVSATFERDRNVAHAMELLFLRPLTEPSQTMVAAARLVLETMDLPKAVYTSAKSVLGMQQRPIVPDDEPTNLIRLFRNELRLNPRNSVAHVELARSWATTGKPEKARDHFRIALSLAPTSRFVLRAAARFFVHLGTPEYAWRVMKDAAKYDPWVAAASISVAQLTNLPMPRSRELVGMIERVADPQQTSELAAALATAELEAGNVKRAKKLFRESALAPTDNVVAQLEWAWNRHGITFDNALLQKELAFEARAAHLAKDEQWSGVVDACEMWLQDEPFSVRPAFEGGFVASELLHDTQKALEFVRRGLLANPYDPGLLNNYAFFLAHQGDLDAAGRTLAQARKLVIEQRSLISIDATQGFIEFRRGNHDAGAQLYGVAIDRANKLGMVKAKQLAFIRYVTEEVRAGTLVDPEWIDKIRRTYSSPKIDDQIKAVFKAQFEPAIKEAEIHRSIAAAQAATRAFLETWNTLQK
ncbi:hypothetical protein ASE71_19600 [Ensifer sp. Root954]|nr:hypothetical protein ASD49_25125 [Ensifer sp. Root1298]KQX90932.1 hypothetical protein ASD41_23815 [Ensifer sp. Root1312]KRC25776.1 hypothetical protein ASE29_22275 [Ensifer sp. Root74]KRD73656.1 hypothetical protein ASE71_19600 [Ensifer sp. Root954]